MSRRGAACQRGIQIVNITKGTTIATGAERATSFLARGRGLMMRSELPDGSALVINPCSSIHMFFMRFPIDVLYMSSDHQVVRVQREIRPWRVGPLYTRGARYVIELPAGIAQRTQTEVGDFVSAS